MSEVYGVYTPSGVTASNDTGSLLSFGTQAADSDVGLVVPAEPAGVDVPASGSSIESYSVGGTMLPEGNVTIFFSNTVEINGIPNSGWQSPGLPAAARDHGVESTITAAIDSIDYATNEITYTAGSWTTYSYVGNSGGPAHDTDLEAIRDPYNKPPNLTYLRGSGPSTTQFNVVK